MSKLSLEEQFTLRALTGRVVGEALVRLYRLRGSLGLVTNKTYICASLTGAVGAAFLTRLGGLARVVTVVTEKPEETKEAVAKLKGTDLVMVTYGGEVGPEVNYPLTRAFLEAAAEANSPFDLFFHVRIWAPGFVTKALKESPRLAEYLSGKNLGTFTFDLERGLFLFHRVRISGQEEAGLETLAAVPLSCEHLDLLKRSL
ncbi:hypothetical protein [Desulfothermobacter acidiphilus]|uniref:hypothetical protein n=1 Tax=Desulfothermobacter acidiphilus TaxID=1938353 RepID=UPI003F8C462D